MAVQNEGLKAFVAGEDLEPYRRVKLSSGAGDTVEYADQADAENFIGFTQNKVKQGEYITVKLKTTGKTFKAVANEAFAAGATLYAGDDGKVSDTSSGNAIATALESADVDGNVVEVLPT